MVKETLCHGCDQPKNPDDFCDMCEEVSPVYLDDSQCDYIEARMHDGFRALYRGELGFAPVVRQADGSVVG